MIMELRTSEARTLQHDVWHKVKIPIKNRVAVQKLRYLIRKGISDHKRKKMWLIITGAQENMKNLKLHDLYEEKLHQIFGEKIPRRIEKPPLFGGELKYEPHYLTIMGEDACKRILCIIGMEYPDINFCPFMPDLVNVFLHYLSEENTYYIIHTIFSRAKEEEYIHIFLSLKEFSAFVKTFNDIVRMQLPKIWKRLQSLGIDCSPFAEKWFRHLFVDYLPYPTMLHLLDSFLSEGVKILYRVGLALLKLHNREIMHCQDASQIVNLLHQLSSQDFNETKLMKTAFQFHLSRKHYNRYHRKTKTKLNDLISPCDVYYRPKVIGVTNSFPDYVWETIYEWLPPRHRIQDPSRIFNSEVSGYSFKNFLKSLSGYSPTLVVLRSGEGNVFGLYMDSPWNAKGNPFIGSTESYLFTLLPDVEHFRWKEGQSENFLYVDQDGFKMGVDEINIGLHIKEDWCGSSETCEIFENKPLNGTTTSFTITTIEAFIFN
eukprot:TRINITY_DN1313_c0_g1_i2.p1 TRINITY_DN1313_c0_g1~~TRINITY_DN1313_c0_g1_i2.p1  ORF type:complete len:487 (-),score=73.48 TRINITY_DN1313_c0_g1_i2:1043-2503(-)